jgi:hypothetical protein
MKGMMMVENNASIAWPTGLEPGKAYVHAHNEMLIPAGAPVCFAWLCRATLWPTWYSNCGGFKFDTTTGPDLAPGTSFTWNTFGAPVHSTVRRFEPPLHLEWDATAFGIRAYHGWVIVPQGDQCQVITEETQIGPVPFFLRWYLNGMLHRGHQIWLEGLKMVTVRGLPPL